MPKVVDLEQGSPEWKQWRRWKITSTVPAILTRDNTYKSPRKLWKEVLFGEEQSDNPFMAIGREQEPLAIDWLEKEVFDTTIYRGLCLESDEDERFAASLDGALMDGREVRAVIEVKTPRPENFDNMCNELPEMYRVQILWHMYVANCDIGYGVVWDVQEQSGFIHLVKPDEEKLKFMKEQSLRFLNHLDRMEMPPYKWLG